MRHIGWRHLSAALTALVLATNAQGATISVAALNDGNGAGLNPGVGTQPIGVAETLAPFAGLDFDYFAEPAITNGTNVTSLSATNSLGVSMSIMEGTFDSFGASGVAANLSAIDFTSSNIDFEASANGGTSQGSGASAAWGVDTDGNINSSSNAVLSFSLTNNTAGTFSTVLLDLEGGGPNGAALAFVAVYDGAGTLDTFQSLMFPGTAHGDSSEILFTIMGLALSSHIVFFVGDDDDGGNGYVERLAAADFATFSATTPVPLPAPILMLGAGHLGLAGMRRKS